MLRWELYWIFSWWRIKVSHRSICSVEHRIIRGSWWLIEVSGRRIIIISGVRCNSPGNVVDIGRASAVAVEMGGRGDDLFQCCGESWRWDLLTTFLCWNVGRWRAPGWRLLWRSALLSPLWRELMKTRRVAVGAVHSLMSLMWCGSMRTRLYAESAICTERPTPCSDRDTSRLPEASKIGLSSTA